jgi:hypothetical protein
MFESVDTSKELSARLRQDMNPAVPGVILPVVPLTPLPPAEDIFDKPITPPTPIVQPAPVEDIAPEVEVAPFASQVSDWRKKYLAWVAVILILPSSFFWFTSLLYTSGAKFILLKIVTIIPFIIIIILNVVLPILAIVAAVIMLWRTEPGDKGRLIAKISLGLAIVCLLSLSWWLIDEVI